MLKKQITSYFFITVIFSLISCYSQPEKISIPYEMQFNKEYAPLELEINEKKKEVKILQLADIQISKTSESYIKQEFDFLTKLIEQANPDILALTGDNVQGPFGEKLVKRLIPFLDSFNIPFIAVFGNHDNEGWPKIEQAKVYLEAKNSLFQVGPTNIHGVGNYQLNLVQNKKVKFSFYMIDSNVKRTYSLNQRLASKRGGKGYDYIYPDQIAWYAWSVNQTTKINEKIIPSFAFFHIALPEYRDYVKAAPKDILITQSKLAKEPVANPLVNTGFFDVIKELGSTKAIFVGHDHVNNYVFKKDGIILAYGLKSGKTSYYHKKLQGGTIITLKNDFQDIEIKHHYVLD